MSNTDDGKQDMIKYKTDSGEMQDKNRGNGTQSAETDREEISEVQVEKEGTEGSTRGRKNRRGKHKDRQNQNKRPGK